MVFQDALDQSGHQMSYLSMKASPWWYILTLEIDSNQCSSCPLFLSRTRSVSAHRVAMDTFCVHRGRHPLQRPEELPCWPVSSVCCSLVTTLTSAPALGSFSHATADMNTSDLCKLWKRAKCWSEVNTQTKVSCEKCDLFTHVRAFPLSHRGIPPCLLTGLHPTCSSTFKLKIC